MRTRPAHYVAFGLKDGTVFGALQTRKPLKKSLRKGENIDPDGVYRFHMYDHTRDLPANLPDRDWIIQNTGIAGRLNTRRALRDLVLPKLDELQREVDTLTSQLTRIEEKLDRLLATDGNA
ncbi:hypothetical protein ACERK3_01465 [Phycisphaerales bacterium AB-hyl4]|uniref:Uncharacterized protein n=1 Tax=Natronomicrosphaera hydrolytica TaxID=3242702 RepID=A0ABV4U2D9_9BACT